MLVTSIFSFSCNVIKSLVSKGRQKVSLCGNELNTKEFLIFENMVGKRACKAASFIVLQQCQHLSSASFVFYEHVHVEQVYNFVVWLKIT
jgi:hypothetical protein